MHDVATCTELTCAECDALDMPVATIEDALEAAAKLRDRAERAEMSARYWMRAHNDVAELDERIFAKRIGTIAGLRFRLAEVEAEHAHWRARAIDAEEWRLFSADCRAEIARITQERARLVQKIERMRGEHYARAMAVVNAAKAYRRACEVGMHATDWTAVDAIEISLLDAVDAYERGETENG